MYSSMKKSLIFSGIFSGLLVTLGALSSSEKAHAAIGPFGFGLTGGVSLNKPAVPAATNMKYGMGYFGGIIADIGAGPIGATAEILYSQRNYEEDITDATLVEMTRLEIPLYARFSVGGFVNLLAGGYFATRIGETTVDDVGDVADLYERADYGLSGGIAFSVPAGPVGFMISARYLYGLTDLDKGAGAFTELKHRSIDLGASLMF